MIGMEEITPSSAWRITYYQVLQTDGLTASLAEATLWFPKRMFRSSEEHILSRQTSNALTQRVSVVSALPKSYLAYRNYLSTNASHTKREQVPLPHGTRLRGDFGFCSVGIVSLGAQCHDLDVFVWTLWIDSSRHLLFLYIVYLNIILVHYRTFIFNISFQPSTSILLFDLPLQPSSPIFLLNLVLKSSKDKFIKTVALSSSDLVCRCCNCKKNFGC